MGRKEELKSATAALNKFAETIGAACFEQHGIIFEQAENDAAIKALQKHNLVYYIDEHLGVQVHSSTKRLVNHVTKRYQLRQSSAGFTGLVDDLTHTIESYRIAKRKGSLDDQQLYQDQIQELVAEIMDVLAATVQSFAYQVNNEFSTISDLDIRIRENKRCLSEIKRLNIIFNALSVKQMRQLAGLDVMLERLLMKVFKRHIDIALKELNATAHRLNEMLAKLIKDKETKRLNLLIDGFYRHYQKNPAYAPTLDACVEFPDAVNRVAALNWTAYADLDNALDEDVLDNLAVGAVVYANRPTEEQSSETFVEVSDSRDEVIDEEVDSLDENVEFFFEGLLDKAGIVSLSAIEAHKLLAVDADPEDWMLALMEHFEAQRRELGSRIKVTLDEQVVLPYSGNHLIRDIVFARV